MGPAALRDERLRRRSGVPPSRHLALPEPQTCIHPLFNYFRTKPPQTKKNKDAAHGLPSPAQSPGRSKIVGARGGQPPAARLVLAAAPRDVELLGEGKGGVVVGDLADGGAVGAGEGDAVVDVEDAIGAARREDVAGGRDDVRLCVHLALGPDAATLDRRLRRRRRLGILAEVVGAVEVARHTLLEQRVAVVRALEDRELEAAGVLSRGTPGQSHSRTHTLSLSLLFRLC